MSTLRDDVLLALAKSDGQPWSSIAEATRHTAEFMYGKQADAAVAAVAEWLGSDEAHNLVADATGGWELTDDGDSPDEQVCTALAALAAEAVKGAGQ